VSTSFADIFRNNALKNGLLPIVVDAETHRGLFDLLDEVPGAEVTVDLAAQSLRLPTGQAVAFPIDGFSKACLLKGTDELGYLLGFESQIAAYESRAQS
jgi:3-isopropylmalate/(R)-2-methylmalate dehydratase small subunit